MKESLEAMMAYVFQVFFFFLQVTIKICERTGQELRLQLSKNPENNLNS